MAQRWWRILMGQEEAGEPALTEAAPETAEVPPHPAETTSELISLMKAACAQVVDLQCENDRIAAQSRLAYDTLVTRMGSVAPLLERNVDALAESERSVARLSVAQGEAHRQLADARRDVAHYRPLALRLEDEQRANQKHIADLIRVQAELTAKHEKAQRTVEDQFQKIAITEGNAQRVAEQNVTLEATNHEKDFAIEALSRENVALKSDIVGNESDLDRQVREIADLTKSLSFERDQGNRAQAAAASIQADYDRLKAEALLQVKDFETRERKLGETLAQRDWQIYDFEIKTSAATAKIEALTRTTERQRTDILRHLDHIGKLEASSRHLLDTLSRNAGAAAAEQPEPPRNPQLRAVSEG